MQPLTAAPRDTLTAAQVRSVLTAPAVSFGFGADLLSPSLGLVRALDVSECTVSHDASAVVQGTVQMTGTYKPAPTDRVRPWLSLTDGRTVAAWHLGVYSPETPETRFGKTPLAWATTGYDSLSALSRPLADTWVTPPDTNVFNEIDRLLVAAQYSWPVLRDSTAVDSTYPAGNTWPADGTNTYLTVLNALLQVIVYQSAWPDWDGNLRMQPLALATTRPVEWPFIVGDPSTGIVTDDPQISQDVYGAANQWVFTDNAAEGDPVDGVSRFVYDNLDTGPSSQNALGRINPASPQGLDTAGTYEALVALGTAIALKAVRATETIPVTSRKFPQLWHSDLASYLFPALGGQRIMQSTQWSLALHDLSQMGSTWQTVSGS